MKKICICLLAASCMLISAFCQEPEIIRNDLRVSITYKTAVKADSIYYFVGHDGDNDFELWRTNGSPVGTYRVANVFQGGPAYPGELTMVGDQLFFMARDDNGSEQLYKSDGTTEGTEWIYDVDPDAQEQYHMLTSAGGLLYFRTSRPVIYTELWVSDGTTGNTHMVTDICGDEMISYPHELTDFNGTLAFIAEDCETGDETLYVTEGLNGPVQQVGGQLVGGLMVAGDHLFFHSNFEDYGSELSASMGGSFDVARASDIYPGKWSSNIFHITQLDSLLLFRAYEPDHGAELWSYNLNSATVAFVKDISPGPNNSSFPSELIAFKGKLYFSANDGVHGEELWVSDGTEVGTYMLKNICEEPGEVPYHSYPSRFFATDSLLYFKADDFIHGPELWQTDGTAGGTRMVADIWPSGNDGSDPGGFAEAGDYLIFNAWYGKRTLFRLKIHNNISVQAETKSIEPPLIHIYPNPARTTLYLDPQLKTAFQYHVFNLSGIEVLNGSAPGEERTILDISDLQPGLYIMQVISGNVQQTARFGVR